MPHRITHIPTMFTDALAMMAIFCANLTSQAASPDNWTKAIGPYGGYFISLAMLGLFIQRDRAATKQKKIDAEKSESATERRHAESFALQKENSEKLILLTRESITAQAKATVAIESVDRTIQYLTSELERKQ